MTKELVAHGAQGNEEGRRGSTARDARRMLFPFAPFAVHVAHPLVPMWFCLPTCLSHDHGSPRSRCHHLMRHNLWSLTTWLVDSQNPWCHLSTAHVLTHIAGDMTIDRAIHMATMLLPQQRFQHGETCVALRHCRCHDIACRDASHSSCACCASGERCTCVLPAPQSLLRRHGHTTDATGIDCTPTGTPNHDPIHRTPASSLSARGITS